MDNIKFQKVSLKEFLDDPIEYLWQEDLNLALDIDGIYLLNPIALEKYKKGYLILKHQELFDEKDMQYVVVSMNSMEFKKDIVENLRIARIQHKPIFLEDIGSMILEQSTTKADIENCVNTCLNYVQDNEAHKDNDDLKKKSDDKYVEKEEPKTKFVFKNEGSEDSSSEYQQEKESGGAILGAFMKNLFGHLPSSETTPKEKIKQKVENCFSVEDQQAEMGEKDFIIRLFLERLDKHLDETFDLSVRCNWGTYKFQLKPEDYKKKHFVKEVFIPKKDGFVGEVSVFADGKKLVKVDNLCHDLRSIDFNVKGVDFKMILVEGGTFWMGSEKEQMKHRHGEICMQQVTLSPYLIGETTVTNELWQTVMGYSPSAFDDCKSSDMPANCIRFGDSRRFIYKLNEMTGNKFNLPTEAQWEFAARGGVKSNHTKYSGSDNIDVVGWYADNSDGQLHPVKQKKPNELGIYDMTGNQNEWCRDLVGDYKYGTHLKDPILEKSEDVVVGIKNRMFRGGDYEDKKEDSTVSFRNWGDISNFGKSFGFRLCHTFRYTECYKIQDVKAVLLGNDVELDVRFKVLVNLPLSTTLKATCSWGYKYFEINPNEAGEDLIINKKIRINKPSKSKKDIQEVSVIWNEDEEVAKVQVQIPENNERLYFNANGVGFNMIRVEGGTFMMGATPEMTNPERREKPAHQVSLSSYYIGESIVTTKLWYAVMGNDAYPDLKSDDTPIRKVSEAEITRFLEKISLLTGHQFQLPTEAQWEFAARGGVKSKHTVYAGSDDFDEVGWRRIHKVMKKKPNELGLYDMSGNMMERCRDYCGDYTENAQINPVSPPGYSISDSYPNVGRGDADDGRVSARNKVREYGHVSFRLFLSENNALTDYNPDYYIRKYRTTTELKSPFVNHDASVEYETIPFKEIEGRKIFLKCRVPVGFDKGDIKSVTVEPQEDYITRFCMQISDNHFDWYFYNRIVELERKMVDGKWVTEITNQSETEKFLTEFLKREY